MLHEKLWGLVTANDQRVLAMLTGVQKEQFEKCRDGAEELSALMAREAFSSSFRLVVKIMAEVIDTIEIPDKASEQHS